MGDQLASGGILVKALPILPRAKAVIETLRPCRATGNDSLAREHSHVNLSSLRFQQTLVRQLPGLAN